MTWFASANCRVAIGTAAINALTDTYTNIGEIESIPQFGTNYQKVSFTSISTRNETSRKGTRQGFDLSIPVGLDPSDVGQNAFKAAVDIDAYYNFRVTLNDAAPVTTSPVTITIAAPGVITWTGHGLTNDTPVVFSTTGALPTGIVAGTTYFVRNAATNTFELSLTRGGVASITTSGTQSGTHTATTAPVPTNYFFKGAAASFQPNPGGVNDPLRAMLMIFGQPGTVIEQLRAPNPVGA